MIGLNIYFNCMLFGFVCSLIGEILIIYDVISEYFITLTCLYTKNVNIEY